ncbi:MAG: hypothetical protein WD424_11405 [Paenibacillaceae bacterium]
MKRMAIIVLLMAAILAACANNTQNIDHSGMDNGSEQDEEHGGHGIEHGGDSTIKPEEVNVVWTFAEETPKSGMEIILNIQVQDNDHKPIEYFDISHEKKLHLIVVSKDFSYFHHIHPEYIDEGLFEIKTQFPSGGAYKLFADFIPTGGEAMTKSKWIEVEGNRAPSKAFEPDSNLTKSVGGKEVTLSIDQLQAGKEVILNFTIKDDKTKEPINNLEQYLGAVGHVVILTEDAEQYLHVHPMEEKATGPDAKFATTFPQSGIYKIWGQFQHKGQVFTIPFVVKIP